MRKIILGMQVSLDGYIEGPNGAMDWIAYNDNEQWQSLFNQLRSVDTFILGRVMYPDYENYWDSVLNNTSSGSKNEVEYAQFAKKTHHIVFSKTLEEVKWENTQIVKNDIKDEVLRLKQQSGKDIVVLGGAKLASSFIKHDLVDEYRLIVNPVILGGGKFLYQDLGKRTDIKLVKANPLKSGAVELYYVRNKSEV